MNKSWPTPFRILGIVMVFTIGRCTVGVFRTAYGPSPTEALHSGDSPAEHVQPQPVLRQTINASLMYALYQLEVGGRPPDGSYGPYGELGPLQITPAVVQDVNRVFSTGYTHSDMQSAAASRAVCRLYLIIWGAEYIRRYGIQPTDEVYARIWHGGPRGYAKKATEDYGRRAVNLISITRGECE